jgi:hypothetical protein
VFDGLFDHSHRHLNSYIANTPNVRECATLKCLWRMQSKE